MDFSLVNQLQEVLEEVKELKENQKRTDKVLKRELWGSDFVIVRAATLDEWAANRQADFDGNRNALVHGGRLHADIETIRIFSPTEPERVDRWK